MTTWSRLLRIPGLVLAMIAVTMLGSMVAPGSAGAVACNGGGRIVNSGNLTLSNCTITGQTVVGDVGGGVKNTGSLELIDVEISGNSADQGGGGIYNEGSLKLTDVVITGNSTGSDGVGGGIWNNGGTLIMSNVSVTGNTAGVQGGGGTAGGGGIANDGSAHGAMVTVANNTTFTGDGGGILNRNNLCLGSGLTFSECALASSGGQSLVQNNHASTGNGGGIANTGNQVILSDSTVDQNGADGGDGGGLWNEGGTLSMFRSTISTNSASGSGGGIANDGGSAGGENLTVASNLATANGGGVYTTDGFTFLASSTIANNTAAQAGGVFSDATSITQIGSTLIANTDNCSIATLTDDGYNLETANTCGFSDPSDQINVSDPGLGPLGPNGGPPQGSSNSGLPGVPAPMETISLMPTSPAVDTGNPNCPPPATDERGVTRPQDGNGDGTSACDIGAYELAILCPNANPLLGLAATGGKLCTILQVDAAKVDITGPAGQIQGNLCIGPKGKLSMSGDNFATTPGVVLLDATASCAGCQIGKRISSVDQPVDLGGEITACNQAAAANQPAPAGLLACGPLSRQTLTGTQTILGAAGKNVICVGDVNVGNNQRITLSRDPAAVGPDTTFVFVVTGKFVIQGKIKTDGTTVQPADVLYNVIGAGAAIAFSGGGGGAQCCKAEIDGTLIGLDRKWGVSPGLINGQACGAMDMSFSSGSGVHCPAQ
jgi:hypothetical protein